MKKKIFIYFLILIIIESCQQNQTKPNKCYNCFKGITAINLDSLPLIKSFSDYDEFIDINDGFRTKINGKVKEIREYYYTKSRRFDEDVLTPTREIITLFNDKNQLIKSTTKIIPEGIEYVSAENSYSEENKLITEGSFQKNYKKINMHSYSENGKLKSVKTKWDFNATNLSDRNMSNISWGSENSYHYNNNGQLTKEIEKYFGGDSCVVKYDYEEIHGGLFYQIIKYDKRSGDRSSITNLSYDEKNNTLSLTSWRILLHFSNDEKTDENLESQIVIFFDDNCNVSKVTKVEKGIKSTKKYSLLEFNKQGDLVSKRKLIYPDGSEKDNNFNYLEEFDFKYILEPEYEYYEYVYDNNGNWIKRTNDEELVTRKIKYRN